MRIIIRREQNFQSNKYCLLEFTGQFEGDQQQQKSSMHLGTLIKTDPAKTKDKSSYILEIGSMDISGFQVSNLEEIFVHVQTVSESEQERVLLLKGLVTKKIVFNKRPYSNIERAALKKHLPQKFGIFKKL